MADKRMIARSVIDNDRFMSMPLSAQALYFHMSLRADDDGFIGNLGALGRMLMAQESDLQALIDGGFVLAFQDGVAAIAHWKMHNCIKKDRYRATVYTKEMEAIEQDGNGVYCLRTQEAGQSQTGDSPETVRRQTGASPETVRRQTGARPETVRRQTGARPETVRRQTGAKPETRGRIE